MPKFTYFIPAGVDAPRWANQEKTRIDLKVFFPHLDATVDYTAAQNDPGWEHSEEIFARAAAGEFGEVLPFVAPVIIPSKVSSRQFFLALSKLGVLSPEEGRAVIRGTLPASWQASLDQLPDQNMALEVEVSILKAQEFERNHPLMEGFGQLLGFSPEQIDDLFVLAGGL